MPKKKKKAAGDGSEMDDAAKVARLTHENTALRLQLAQKTQDALKAEREMRELRSRVTELRSDFRETADDTFAITADMTRQYKAMEKKFLDDITKLEDRIRALEDELAEARTAYEELQEEKVALLKAKDEEIALLKDKAEDMAAEFAEMLQETLRRMADKIEISAAKWDGDGSVPVIQRMKEFTPSAGGGASAGGSGAGAGT